MTVCIPIQSHESRQGNVCTFCVYIYIYIYHYMYALIDMQAQTTYTYTTHIHMPYSGKVWQGKAGDAM